MATLFYCDEGDGRIVSVRMGPAEQMAVQPEREGMTRVVVDDGLVDDVYAPFPDFGPLREHLRAQIDVGAGALRKVYITDVPGQAQTYEKKEAEARGWTEGDEGAHPERYPFMLAEAAVRGLPIAQVRDEILAQVEQLTPLAALIEAHRVCAKQRVLEATTLPGIVAAAEVDWAGVLAELQEG